MRWLRHSTTERICSGLRESTAEGFCGERGGERAPQRQRETWLLSSGRASAGLLEQIKEWPVGGECVVSPDRGNTGCTAGSLRDQQAQGHVDFIGFHSFSSEYLLCFCAFVIRPAQTHTCTHTHAHAHTHTHAHGYIHLSMLPLSLSLSSLSLSLLEWVLCS